MMGNHIIKAARCALLPASRRIKKKRSQKKTKQKQQQVMGSKNEGEEEEGRVEKKKQNKNTSLRKSSQKTDRKEPSGTGLTSSLTPDCQRKTISPLNKEYLFSPFSAAAAERGFSFSFFPSSLQPPSSNSRFGSDSSL